MVVLWFIIIVQFGLIGWLAYRNFKPQAVDHWKRAEDMIARWKNSDKENWELDFKQAQGIIEPPTPAQAQHELINVKSGTYLGMPRLIWYCRCGEEGESYTAAGVDLNFDEHKRAAKLVEKFRKV